MPKFERLDVVDTLNFSGSFLKIDLIDKGELEIEKFDEAASVLTFEDNELAQSTGIYGLKHLVLGDVMFAFKVGLLEHLGAYYVLRRIGIQGELQSAGKVGRNFNEELLVRAITDWSFSLTDGNLLSPKASDKYKFEVIKPILGNHFQVR